MSDSDKAFLASLTTGGDAAYEALLDSHGGVLALAAYQLVCAQLRVAGVTGPPKSFELRHAAEQIHRAAGLEYRCPVAADLRAECVDHGLPMAES